jgi:hypothetical protein
MAVQVQVDAALPARRWIPGTVAHHATHPMQAMRVTYLAQFGAVAERGQPTALLTRHGSTRGGDGAAQAWKF